MRFNYFKIKGYKEKQGLDNREIISVKELTLAKVFCSFIVVRKATLGPEF